MSEYVHDDLETARCPECGNEACNYEVVAQGRAQPVPYDQRARCPECETSGDPIQFRHEYEWARMGEDERQAFRDRQARADDRLAEYQASAHAISMRREP